MPLRIVQCLAAILALTLTMNGFADTERALTTNLLLSSCGPIVWLLLARTLTGFYPAAVMLIGGIFVGVFMIPGVYLPQLATAGNQITAAIGIGILLALNLWSAYHARWAQLFLFNKQSSM